MKKTVLARIVVLLLVPALAYGEQRPATDRGNSTPRYEKVDVPADMPIMAKNPEGVRKYGEVVLPFGATCTARQRGTFTPLGDLSPTRVVVRYDEWRFDSSEARRSDCPDGTLTVMTHAQLADVSIGITPGMSAIEREKKRIAAVEGGYYQRNARR